MKHDRPRAVPAVGPMTPDELRKWAQNARSLSAWTTPRIADAILAALDAAPTISDPIDRMYAEALASGADGWPTDGRSLSYGEIADIPAAFCMSSPDGKGPHRPDDTTEPLTCAECGALIEKEAEA